MPRATEISQSIKHMLQRVDINFVGVELAKRSFRDTLRRKRQLATAACRARVDRVQVEGSINAGLFRKWGLRNYVVDVHGLTYAEVAVSHGQFYWRDPPVLAYFLEMQGVKVAPAVVVVSERMRNVVVRKWGVDPSRITVVPNGYSKKVMEGLPKVSTETGRVTFVGVLSRWANVERLVKAAKLLVDTDLNFSIIGGGPDFDRLQRLSKRIGVRTVTFNGILDQSSTYRFIASSEILVAPLPNVLALQVADPIKVIEYGALGKPMVLDPVGDLPQTLVSQGGAVAPVDDTPHSFADALRNLAGNLGVQRRIGEAAQRMCKPLTWERSGALLAERYAKLGNHRGPGQLG